MRRLTKITISTVVALAAIPGLAVAQDLRSPDARDSARQVTGATGASILNGRDLVSPDARDSARHLTGAVTDLRSPDARESTPGVSTYTPGQISTTPIAARRVVLPAANGFDWGDAGIGAAGMLALIALVAGTLMVATHRRRDRGFRVAAS
ncbi:MAG: hypothetical protein ACJ76Z_06090 [Thermoleophilaceae bacterium]